MQVVTAWLLKEVNANQEARTWQGEEDGRSKGNMPGTGKMGQRRGSTTGMGRPGAEVGMCVGGAGGGKRECKYREGLDMI